MDLVTQVWNLLTRREKGQVSILVVAMLLRATIGMVGVASIMPFMSVVANPEVIQTNRYLGTAYSALGFASVTAFLFVLGVAVVVMMVLANAVGALTHYGIVRFTWGMHHRLSIRLLEGYLSRPYAFFTQRNSAGLSKTLLGEIKTVITGVMTPLLDIGARMLGIIAVVGLLVVLDPALALTMSVILGGVYGVIYLAVRRKQRRLGVDRVRANKRRFKAAGEAFGGIKDVKVLQREKSFIDQYRSASWTYSKATASNAVIQQIPRYIIETIAFGGIVLIVLYHLWAGNGVEQILPVLSLYGFAGYRLMPELQSLFGDFAKIRFNRAALDDLLADYYALPPGSASANAPRLPFRQHIRFEGVTFQYAGAPQPALLEVSLSIERNQSVALVGASGAGKTTLVDLLLGLYEPNSGKILIDGIPLDSVTLGAWRRQIGYVPQHIFLTDDSIAANIAFGVPPRKVDLERVEQAARIANLHDFIITLPKAYGTVVGERGVRLSGGQRQRIGLARALYYDPEILVLDEATSALDGATESAVMEAIHKLAGQKTIVLIAHRLSTVADCDVVYVLENGRVQDSGSYGELAAISLAFRRMARLEPAAS